jgi:hypothetical protein
LFDDDFGDVFGDAFGEVFGDVFGEFFGERLGQAFGDSAKVTIDWGRGRYSILWSTVSGESANAGGRIDASTLSTSPVCIFKGE